MSFFGWKRRTNTQINEPSSSRSLQTITRTRDTAENHTPAQQQQLPSPFTTRLEEQRDVHSHVAPPNRLPPNEPSKKPEYPWSTRLLRLPPPAIIPKPGIAPPTKPSPSPFPRYGHSLPPVATQTGELLLFGGLVKDSVRNDLYSFSSRELSATLFQTAGEVPAPRVGHASALVSSVLIVWGGDTRFNGGSDQSLDDGLYLLNLGKPV